MQLYWFSGSSNKQCQNIGKGGGQYISLATASTISCELQRSNNGESYVSPLDTVESWPWLEILTSPVIADIYFQLGKYAVSQIGA